MTNKILLSALAVGTLALAANPAHTDDWSYQFEPYLWGLSIEGDAGIGRIDGRDIDVDFGDILDTLDMGLMARFEAHHENGWGVALDYAFLDVSDDITGPRGGVLDAEVRMGVFDALLVKAARSGDEQLDYFAGLRWGDIDVDVAIDPVILPGTASSSVSEDWIDLVVGIRWTNPLNEKWSFTLHGDVGGGGTDFTASGIVGFRYEISDSKELNLQYKALYVDYETGTPGQQGYFKYDTTNHGPVIGLIFKF
jgi:hypothetical protein